LLAPFTHDALKIDLDRGSLANTIGVIEPCHLAVDFAPAGTAVAPFDATTGLVTVAVKVSPTLLDLVPISWIKANVERCPARQGSRVGWRGADGHVARRFDGCLTGTGREEEAGDESGGQVCRTHHDLLLEVVRWSYTAWLDVAHP
jgi:hypothetical protein